MIKLLLSLALLKHEVKFTHFNSRVFILDFTWNCGEVQEAKKFQGTQVNLSVLLEKPDITRAKSQNL